MSAVWVGAPESTQDLVKAWAEQGRPHGVAVMTDSQRAGRGRLGRTWASPPGSGLQLSVLLRPGLAPRRVALVSLAAAVALRDVCGPAYGIKWPNDLWSPDGRKVAGVLAEADIGGGVVRWVAVGIGVNLTAAPLPDADFLAAHGETRGARSLGEALVAAVLARVDQAVTAPATVLAAWSEGDALRGREVTIGSVSGVADGLAEDGGLRVHIGDEVVIVRTGEVGMVGPA